MIYSKGTAAVTLNSQTVTGTGTRWAKRIHAGDVFQLEVGGPLYLIAEVSSDTSLILAAEYAGSTDATADYTIVSDFSRYFSVPYPRNQDIEKASVMRRSTTRVDTLLGQLSDRIFNVEYPPGSVVDIVATPSVDTVYIGQGSGGALVTADSTVTADSNLVLADGFTLGDPLGSTITADSSTVRASSAVVTADGFNTP